MEHKELQENLAADKMADVYDSDDFKLEVENFFLVFLLFKNFRTILPDLV